MYLQQTRKRKFRLALWMVPVAFWALFFVCFPREVLRVLWFFISAGLILLGFELPLDTSPEMIRALGMVGFNILFGFGLVFFLWLGRTAAQALLPVEGLLESYRAAWHLVLYILRLHGPAIFVKDGVQLASTQELQRLGPGVVVIDFNSAAVLEEQVPPPSFSRPFKNLVMQLLIQMGLSDASTPTRMRTCGPGIVFTRRRERIRAAVDLRRQVRIRPATSTYTRDGIEVNADLWTIFTIGQDADVLPVAYQGERRPENLRVVRLELVAGGSRVRVVGFSNDLDEADRLEIHRYARVVDRLEDIMPFNPAELERDRRDSSEQKYIPGRVFAAAISEARGKSDELMPWQELPPQVAVDLFRGILSQVNYDEFFGLNAPDEFPLPAYKRRLSAAMRCSGILGYRLLFHQARVPLQVGMEYELPDLLMTVRRQLNGSKILRDRGIKVIASEFREIAPSSDLVLQQRIANWSAAWQRDAEVVRANGELAAMRVRAREEAIAQQSLYLALKEILSNEDYSKEALALRVLQALENAAEDPETRKLLPQNTMDTLKTIHTWLLPGDYRSTKGPTA